MAENETITGPELTHEQTVTRMKDIRDEIERLEKRDDLDADDRTRWDGLKTEFVTLREHKERLERKADLAEIRSAFTNPVNGARVDAGTRAVHETDNAYDVDPMADVRSADDLRRRNPWDLSNVRSFGMSPEQIGSEYRARALDAIEKMRGATDSIRQAGTQILDRFGDEDGVMARYILASSSPAYMRAFAKAFRGQRLDEAEERAVNELRSAARAMSTTDNAGGYLIPFQLDPTVIITSDGSFNQIRQIARQVVATGDVWNGVSSPAVTWAFAAEATQASDNATTFAGPAITVRKAQGWVPISKEALADASNVTAEVGRLLAEGKDDLESVKFVSGAAASNEPIGIVTALTGGSSVVASATTDTLALADVAGLVAALPAKHRMRANWLANYGFYSAVRPLDVSHGVWQDPRGDVPATLYGKGVYEAEAMDGTVTATEDNLIAIVGDFRNYVIADRLGTTVEFVPQVFGANQRPTGQSGWYAYYRVGADSVNDAAFRMLNVT
jgi:HK97 family phage major capsid protein